MPDIIDPLTFYKCLAEDTRLRCLLLMEQQGELCVCELVEALQDIQPKISRHLAQLKKQQLLIDRRQGQWVFYRINPSIPSWAKQVLSMTLASNKSLLKQNLKYLNQMGSRPERTKACC